MKRSDLSGILIALAVFTACSKDLSVRDLPSRDIGFTVNASDATEQSRTYLDADGRTILWGTGEYLQLYYNDGKDNFAKSLNSSADRYSGQAVASFDYSISPASAPAYRIGGIYPASSVITVGGIINDSPSAYKIGLKSPQVSKDGRYDPEAMILVMKPDTVTSLSGSADVALRRAVALNHFVLTGVEEAVRSVEIIAPGYALGGKREIDLTTGESGTIYERAESISVQFDTPKSPGTVDLWFTSWGISEEQTEELIVRIEGTENTYTKYIQVGGNGLTLAEGKLNKLTLNFSGIEPDRISLSDFAEPFANILSIWETTVGDVSVATGDAPKVFKNVNYLPSDLKINVGNISLNKANMFDVALNGYISLSKGGTLSDKMPAPHSYPWGDNPYNELPGNGGEFANWNVDLAFISNFCSRQNTFAQGHNIWSNFCGYAGGQLSGYDGVCCLERSLLILARFYQYLIDNNITDNIPSRCSFVRFNAGLYYEATAPEVTINDFAKAFVKVLTTWSNTTTSSLKVGTVTISGHYIPAGTTVTVNSKSYDKAQTYDIALKAMYKLLGGGKMSDAMPEASDVKWSGNPYLEGTGFGNSTVSLNFIKNSSSRQQGFLESNDNVFANYCSYGNGAATTKGTPSVSGFTGDCSLERSYLIMARLFKYILDKNITSDFASALASVKFDADLYGISPDPVPTDDPYLKGGTYCNISSTTVKNAVAAAYKYYGTTASASASTRAKAIYKYALDKWNYKYYNNTSLGSDRMITSQAGNCCDMAHGIVAMCRCAGIRARYYHAQVYYKSSGRTGHVMAQIDMNNNASNPNWKIADATSNSNTSIGNVTWTDPQSVKTYAILPF